LIEKKTVRGAITVSEMGYSKWQSILTIIAINILLHSYVFMSSTQMTLIIGFLPSFYVFVNTTIAVCQLFFPILGFLGDRYFTRYKILLSGMILSVIGGLAGIIVLIVNYTDPNGVQGKAYFWSIVVPVVLIQTIGMGLIISNILQFGTDQLLDSSFEFHCKIVRWYYWSLFIGQTLMYYLMIIILTARIFPNRAYQGHTYYQTGAGTLAVAMITNVLFVLVILMLQMVCKKKFIIKMPPKAITCMRGNREETTARTRLLHHYISLEYDQTDKTRFIQLILIIISLTSFQLAGDTYSLSEHVISANYTDSPGLIVCPSLSQLLIFGINSEHLPSLIVLIAIPLYHLAMKRKKNSTSSRTEPLLLKKIFIGLMCLLGSVITQMIIGGIADMNNNDSKYSLLFSDTSNISQLTQKCLFYRLNYTIDDDNDMINIKKHASSSYWWILLPQLLTGASYVLISMVILELICTQATDMNKGLLIGLWYMTFTVRRGIQLMDAYIVNGKLWYILKGGRLIIMMALILCYTCLLINFKYKERMVDDDSGYNGFNNDSLSGGNAEPVVFAKVTKVTRKKTNKSYGATTATSNK
jgi:hypothetical protein